ncbi:hypothetical protein [Nocardia transvalensis]|uniref:hypothetical protein n=1 Tax=Nocardia transvalensis TaxID=37333 RepID=UPI0018947C2A|nr:hypothetical protein [Nocardia transvalensis]MBF6333585.1 hypothetical protein [Nocardia transvalensis]
MTEVVFTANYVTQVELAKAYRRLGHTCPTPAWSATLLISKGLSMAWGCPVLPPEELRDEEYPARHDWYVIADAGELDWPPLKPEEQIWPALLEKHPVPTGKQAEFAARAMGKASVEEAHREQLRHHYLGNAYIGGAKRNPTDVNFDPIVRDWDATARALADFLDAHRPPKLTSEQRVMAQGVRLAQLEAAVAATKMSLGHLMRNAARETRVSGDKLRRGFKSDMSRWGGVSRPTVDAWLAAGGCCEGAVPGSDTTESRHTPDVEEQIR